MIFFYFFFAERGPEWREADSDITNPHKLPVQSVFERATTDTHHTEDRCPDFIDKIPIIFPIVSRSNIEAVET